MNTRPQITSVEETIRIPDWRSASPKNFRTFRRSTSPTIFEVNLTISPNDSIQPRGVARRLSMAYLTIVVISGWVASSVCVNA